MQHIHSDVMPKSGEAVVIIGRDGAARLLTIDMDADKIKTKMAAGEELSKDEETDLMVAGKAFALLVAASSDQLMSIINDVASDPEIIDAQKLAAFGRVA